jgi:MFS family permease
LSNGLITGGVSRSLSPNIVMLGLVSLFTAMSSAMVYSLLPVFLVKVLGASVVVLGLMEGASEAANSVMRLLSGACSDWWGRRKPLVLLGYILSAANKFVFPVAESVTSIFAARIIDRLGKGIRDAPRDAFVSDITPSDRRGAGYGLRLSFYTTGFVLGPLAAIALMTLSGDDFRLVFWIAILPAFVAIGVLLFAVSEIPPSHTEKPRIHIGELANFGALFWWWIVIAGLLALSRFSQAFLVLKAHDIGVDAAFVPMILVLTHTVYASASYPFGLLADRLDRRIQLALGGATLICADAILAGAQSMELTAVGAALWGLQLAMTQGLLAASIADAAPEHLRGTAFGIFDVVLGLAALTASAAAGMLWTIGGPILTFGAGAAAASGALLVLLGRPKMQEKKPKPT